MTQGDVLQAMVAKLDASEIPYMLSGSVASSAYGKPRSTEDLDIIISPTLPQLNALLVALPPDEYYASFEAAKAAFFEQSMFNVIDLATGWKVDLIFLKSKGFEKEKFARRVKHSVLGRQILMVTPEDSILSKLEWRKESRSERQYVDAVNVAARIENLDLNYLHRWAKELGISEDLEQLLRDADELRPR